jgi:hypothetical protein
VNRSFALELRDNGELRVKDSQGDAQLWSSMGGLQQKAANTNGTAPAAPAVIKPPIVYGAEQMRKA